MDKRTRIAMLLSEAPKVRDVTIWERRTPSPERSSPQHLVRASSCSAHAPFWVLQRELKGLITFARSAVLLPAELRRIVEPACHRAVVGRATVALTKAFAFSELAFQRSGRIRATSKTLRREGCSKAAYERDGCDRNDKAPSSGNLMARRQPRFHLAFLPIHPLPLFLPACLPILPPFFRRVHAG